MIGDQKKRWEAEDIALAIIDTDTTDVTESKMRRWSDDDLYEWLEAWGFEWRANSWHGTVEIEMAVA